jgi:signal peptidase II
LILFFTAFIALAADQLTKLWIRSSLQPGDFMPDHGPVRLTYSTNDGIIFGIGAPFPVAIAMPIALVGLALLIYFWYGPIRSRLVNVSLGLFIGGTGGNWVDRLTRRSVTDFIDVGLWGNLHWFTFNVADACIIMAIVLFALQVSGLHLTRGAKQRQ